MYSYKIYCILKMLLTEFLRKIYVVGMIIRKKITEFVTLHYISKLF